MMAGTAVVFDHFVLLLDTDEFENPPAWLTENFNIIEGGTHGGKSSRNKLIVFKDGTYLELFNWIKEPVEFLDWSDKAPGLIDFAVTTLSPVTPEQNFDIVKANVSRIPQPMQMGISYAEPLAGGRLRRDGTEVRWKNSRPQFETTTATPDQKYFPRKRVDVPFFCHDVTERTVRVPFDDEKITTHPCGAVGIQEVQVLVPQLHTDAYIAIYGSLLNTGEPKWYMDHRHEEGAYFQIGVPNPAEDRPAYVVVCPSRDYEVIHSSASPDKPPNPKEIDEEFLTTRGIGIQGLTLRTAENVLNSHDIGWFAPDAIGRTIKLQGWLNRPNAGATPE